MQNAKNIETVERAILLNKIACISVTLKFQKILNKMDLKNKDPCYMGRLMYLRI